MTQQNRNRAAEAAGCLAARSVGAAEGLLSLSNGRGEIR